jgi:Ca2+-binding EF-hand superfamily protein
MGANSSDLRGLAADQVLNMIAEYFYSRNMTLSQAFNFLDADMGGTVTWEEFVRGINICLEQTGSHRVSSSDLWPIFKRFDRNGDNRISLEEFSSQFCPASKGTRAQSWYDDDMRRGCGRTIGYGPPVIAPNVAAERRVDDIICRIGAAIVRTGFSPLQLFQKIDLDSNGRLSWAEIERMILSFQPDLSMTERQAIFRRFDRDGSSDVDVNEFCSCIDRCNASALVNVEILFKRLGDRFRSTGQTVSDVFHVFDRNYDGFLQRDEWTRAMRTFDSPTSPLSDADIEAVFKRFDVNGDGYMSIQEVDTFFKDCIQRSQISQDQVQATYLPPGQTYQAQATYQVMPTYQPPPSEEVWEREVLDTVRSCLAVGRSGLQITEVFRRLDINNNESMDVVDFQRMVTAYRSDLASAHVDSLFRKVNTSGNGQITMREFVRRFG